MARLVAAAVIPLTEDEAYYRVWAQHLHLGYYDHPPMVAWWIWLGERVAGPTHLGVRLMPILACAATSLAIFDLVTVLGAGSETARRAALWFQAMPLIALGGMLAIPDSPATLCWCASLGCVSRARDRLSAKWWLAAGIAAGLGLLSKYSMLFLLVGVFAWLVMDRRLGELKKPWPWVGLLVALMIFSLNIYWNAGHHWVSFEKQFGRSVPTQFAPQYLIEFVLGQLLLLGPFAAAFLFAHGHRIAKPTSCRMCGARLMLLATGLPFVGYLVLHALHDRVQAHWPAPLYPALACLAAIAAEGARGKMMQRAKRWALPFGAAVGSIGLVHLALPITDVFGAKDPVEMVRGWPMFAEHLNLLALANRAAWVGTSAYATAAELDDQDALKLPALQLAERDRYAPEDSSQRTDLSKPGLVVDLQRRLSIKDLSACFATVRLLSVLLRGSKDGAHEAYSVYYVAGALPGLVKTGCAIH
ncbi:MAG: glycosyltransferase family 39 protein [Alphaproteobacteria bacterium]